MRSLPSRARGARAGGCYPATRRPDENRPADSLLAGRQAGAGHQHPKMGTRVSRRGAGPGRLPCGCRVGGSGAGAFVTAQSAQDLYLPDSLGGLAWHRAPLLRDGVRRYMHRPSRGGSRGWRGVRAGEHVALFLGVYWNVRRFAGRYVQGVFTLSPYEPDRIRVGDYVLAYVRAYRERDPARGELVLYETPAGGVGEVRLVAGRAVGYVVGLPGESVTVRDDRFYVDGEALSGVRYEVPSWLRGGRLESHLSPNEYFALPSDVAFLYRGRRASPPPELISLLCKPTRSAIVGRVFMVYNPIWRRHFLRRD